MRIARIRWTRDRIGHIARHRMNPEEVEEAVFHDPDGFASVIGIADRNPAERIYRWLGRTGSGRYVTLIFINEGKGIIYLVTARDMDDKERRRYNERR